MVQFRPTAREIVAKIVYYGPPLGGKTTNLKALYVGYPEKMRGELVVLPTGTDRTIYFDYLPINLQKLRGMDLRIQLYTVPGQVRFDSTRQVVLRGVDGVVFVADSQRESMQANLDSWANLKKNLALQGLFLDRLPHVLQFNKRDLSDIASVEELNDALNEFGAPFFEAVAIAGLGVEETFEQAVRLVIRSLRDRFNLGVEPHGGLQVVHPPLTEEVVTRPVVVTPQPLPRQDLPLSRSFPPPEITPPTLPFVEAETPKAVVIPLPSPTQPENGERKAPVAPPEDGAEPPVAEEVLEIELPLEPEFPPAEGGEATPSAPTESAGELEPAESEPSLTGPFSGPWEAAPEPADFALGGELEVPGVEVPEPFAPAPPAEPEVVFGENSEGGLPSGPWELGEPATPVIFDAPGDATAISADNEAPPPPVPEEPLIPAAAPLPQATSLPEPPLLAEPFAVEELPAAASTEDVFALAPRPPVEVVPPAAAIERVIPRAVARHGELRELEVEVPVPATWVGGRRVTLQLRLTLVPEEENHES